MFRGAGGVFVRLEPRLTAVISIRLLIVEGAEAISRLVDQSIDGSLIWKLKGELINRSSHISSGDATVDRAKLCKGDCDGFVSLQTKSPGFWTVDWTEPALGIMMGIFLDILSTK